jgi:hypothetical protein
VLAVNFQNKLILSQFNIIEVPAPFSIALERAVEMKYDEPYPYNDTTSEGTRLIQM